MNAARWVAAAVVAITIGMNAGTLWVVFATDFLDRFMGAGITAIQVAILDGTVVAFMAVTLSYVGVGFLLAGRSGAGRIAAVLLGGGASYAAVLFGYSVGAQLVFRAPEIELANAMFLLGPLAVGPANVLILPALALLFPTGRLPSRRWALPVGFASAAIVLGTIVELVQPGPIASGTPGSHNPFGIEALPAGLVAAAYPLVAIAIVAMMVLAIGAVLARYRTGDAALRQQLRWFVAAVLLAAVPLALAILPGLGGPQWALVASVGLILVPISVGIAVTRYRLFEIDRLISRTIGWALVTGALLAVFVGTVVGLQALLANVTQGETLAVAASTLVAFALFQPLRRRVQSAVDRRFDRARYDGERTIAAFAERLRSEVDLANLEGDIAGTVGSALRPTSTGVWIRDVRPHATR